MGEGVRERWDSLRKAGQQAGVACEMGSTQVRALVAQPTCGISGMSVQARNASWTDAGG